MGQTSIVVILLLSRGLSGSALVVAAAEKLASPGRASRALTQLAELALPRGSQVSPSAVRVAACCEAGVAVYGVSRPLEPTAGIPLLVVGCVFLSLGVLGRLAGATEPCGCFGDANSAPLGLVGVTFGAGLIVITVAGLFVSGYVPTLDWSAPAALLSLVVGASVWTLYRQKSLVHFSWSYVRRTR